VGEALEHHAHQAQIHPRLTGGWQKFVVFAHAAVPADPGERALNDPATWEHVETC
jgi:hypothetical protein